MILKDKNHGCNPRFDYLPNLEQYVKTKLIPPEGPKQTTGEKNKVQKLLLPSLPDAT